MTIWAIADLHASRPDEASGRPLKPMDPFGERWKDHMERLEAAWEELVAPSDTVVIPGDIDWAMHLDDALYTLRRLHCWKGQKLLVRGNHDYWWSSKATNRVRRTLPASLQLLHNDAALVEEVNICGCKGSPVPGGMEWTAEDEKLLQRELHRLQASLEARRPDRPTIVALHYPPFYPSLPPGPYRAALEGYEVSICVYGHLHGEAAASGPHGRYDGVEYRLVAGDYVDFRPVPIWDGGPISR